MDKSTIIALKSARGSGMSNTCLLDAIEKNNRNKNAYKHGHLERGIIDEHAKGEEKS